MVKLLIKNEMFAMNKADELVRWSVLTFAVYFNCFGTLCLLEKMAVSSSDT